MIEFEELRGLNHRDTAVRLLADGWNVCGMGDWATVWRSPDGTRVARVSAFEPAYGVFVRLCRNLDRHPMLPRIDFDAELFGGGRITVMEFLRPASAAERSAVLARWDEAATDDPVSALRREAERLNAEAAATIPFWGALDRNPSNVMRRPTGDPVLVDLFYADGPEIYRVLLEDPAKISSAFPAERRAFIDEIAVIARESTPEEIAALRAAAASIR
ncbi:hypothetical protein [Glycomyces buryatensis]|uniref:Uncharacterized protein n=1 Tax=Glycomyces buryatensis TaxID=2570927 RepID=A0A4S8PT71_9ACTN|nr:hypothetical protein [Glycomyces buryatensis]THV34607.1 hypothetical protein FAB82_23975 [Glycomyces buryatensis]